MKKLVSVILCVVMIFALGAVAYAETESAEKVYTLDDANLDLFDGDWENLGDAKVKMYIPSDWTAEAKEDGVTVYTSADGQHSMTITVPTKDNVKYRTLSDAIKTFIGKGYQKSMVKMLINKLHAVSVITNDGTYIVVVEAPNGDICEISIPDFNKADSTFMSWVKNMVMTISATK